MFESLSGRLEEIFTALRRRGRLRPADVDDALEQIRRALLDADAAVDVVSAFRERVRARSLETDLHKALNPAQHVLKIVHSELTNILGGEAPAITYASRPPTVVLLAGLQGSGKTTAAAKMALWFQKQGRNPLLVGADLTRPAAVEQLRVLGRDVGAPVFSNTGDPAEVAREGLSEARRLGKDVLICDTAGRQVVDDDLMAEIGRVSKGISPHHKFLVLDAMTGQEAVKVGEAFHSVLGLDGLILTKLDGDARGGAVLSLKSVLGVGVAFVSTGERPIDLERFHPERMAGRILGMGDMLTLLERAEQTYDSEKEEEAAQRMMKGQFTFDDFLAQMRQLKKMGGMEGVLSYMPGMGAGNTDLSGDGKMERIEAMICSMTPGERMQPSIIDASRRRRIADGSGTSVGEVSSLLKNLSEARRMMQRLGKSGTPRRGKKKSKKSSGTARKSAQSSRPSQHLDFEEQLKRLRNSDGFPLEWP